MFEILFSRPLFIAKIPFFCACESFNGITEGRGAFKKEATRDAAIRAESFKLFNDGVILPKYGR